jgi:hypothetical protein
VHELDVGIAGRRHGRRVDLVGQELLDPLSHSDGGLAHGHPDVGVEEVGPFDHRSVTLVADVDPGARVGGQLLRRWPGRLGGPEVLGGGDADVHAEQGPGDQQGVGRVVAGVPR